MKASAAVDSNPRTSSEADDDNDVGMMQGISGVDIQIEENPSSHAPGFAIKKDGSIISVLGPQAPVNDYDRDFFIKGHPHSFPNGVGSIPVGMSLKEYSKMILFRYPREQYAQNIGLLADLFNVGQRHDVLTNSRIQLKLAPGMSEEINKLSEDNIRKVLEMQSSGMPFATQQKILQTLPQAAKTLLGAMRRVGGKIIGTPGSFLSLRSKIQAAWNIFGPYTLMMNLCPYENNMIWVFELAGEPYLFDAKTGKPLKNLSKEERARIVAANPVACAHAFKAYLDAFQKVFLGWEPGAERQTNADCLFGIILAFVFKMETGGRGGIHAHGQCIQPLFQVS